MQHRPLRPRVPLRRQPLPMPQQLPGWVLVTSVLGLGLRVIQQAYQVR